MKIISNLVRAAAVAGFALLAGALAPTPGGEAQAQSGWSHGGHRAHYHRAAPRHVYRHRAAPRRVHYRAAHHYAPRRAYHRPARHYHAPRRVYHRPVVRHHYAPRYYRSGFYAPRSRPVHVVPIYVGARHCKVKKRWVYTPYGPRRIKQRVCYRGW